MRTPLATLTLAALLSLPGLASADVYKCPDAAGRQHYQNIPCEGADEPAIISPGPGSSYVPPPIDRHASPPASRSGTPPPHAPHSAPARGGTAVDTHAFGMLEIGTSEAAVVRRLGPPDQIVEDARTYVPVRYSSGRVELREQRRSAWVYAGDNQTLKTVLTFENGQLKGKAKGR
jgi:Domain of unknown function (DUF4124)